MKVKIGDRVQTPDGGGVYVGDDLPDSGNLTRYKVKLDADPYKYKSGVVCYWKEEVVLEKK